MCARFQSNSKESHLSIFKRILRYLKGTPNMGLWYPRSNSYYLLGYTNANYVGSRTNRKSNNGAYQFLKHYLAS